MEGKPRCMKCGRTLKSSLSISRGIGSTCAGYKSTIGTGIHVRLKGSSGVAYLANGRRNNQATLLTGDLPEKKFSKRELARRRREERRQRLERHEPFECGILLPKKVPLVYVPVDGSTWKENPGGRTISHDLLQASLKRYQFI